MRKPEWKSFKKERRITTTFQSVRTNDDFAVGLTTWEEKGRTQIKISHGPGVKISDDTPYVSLKLDALMGMLVEMFPDQITYISNDDIPE